MHWLNSANGLKQIISHLTDNDAYTFSCQYYILQKYLRAEVEYNFFDRNDTIYPEGFAGLVEEQLGYMPQVMITQEEISFMKRRMYYLPEWYFTFLRGYRFNPHEVTVTQDEAGHLQITVRGKWYSAIMWEMPILATISELMHYLRGDFERYNLRPLQNSYPKICSLHYFFVPLWYETNSFFSQFCRCRSRSA